MAEVSKPKLEVPPPIKIKTSEEEMNFWSAIMALDTPNNFSSCPSSAAVSSAGVSLNDEDDIQSIPSPVSSNGSAASKCSPIAIFQSSTPEANVSAKLEMPGLIKQKTKIPMDNDDMNINQIYDDDDDGYVAKSDHDSNASLKPKKKLPSPTTESNSLIEIGMWQLLKQRKKYEKYSNDDDDDEEEEEEDEKQQSTELDECDVVIGNISLKLKHGSVDTMETFEDNLALNDKEKELSVADNE